MQRNREKAKAIVHYTISRCDNPAILGSIKLNKVPWVADVWSYLQTGEAITGENYRKMQHGPTVTGMVGILEELAADEKIVVRQPGGKRTKVDYFSLREPDVSLFTAAEMSLIDEAIQYVCVEHTSAEISEATHDDIWKLAEIGEHIPLYTTIASELGEVMPEDVEWARSIRA
jgi:hypothetical protein